MNGHDLRSPEVSESVRLTKEGVVDLVHQIATAAGLVPPAIVFVPWVSGSLPVELSVIRDRTEPVRLDVAVPALDELSPEAWRYLLAEELAHVRLGHHRFTAPMDVVWPSLGNGALAMAIGVCLYERRAVWPVVGIAAAISVAALAFHMLGYLVCQLRADGYAVRVAGASRDAVDELWDYGALHGSGLILDWLRHGRINRLVRRTGAGGYDLTAASATLLRTDAAESAGPETGANSTALSILNATTAASTASTARTGSAAAGAAGVVAEFAGLLKVIENELGELEEFSKDLTLETGEVLVPRWAVVGVVRRIRTELGE